MENGCKTYPVSWKGELILACRKCQKKVKRDHAIPALAKLKKTIKRHNKDNPDHPLHVMDVPCMDLCPKDGVTICCPARDPESLSILRNEHDVEWLYRGAKQG